MADSSLGLKWIKLAALYLLVGVLFGLHMGKSHDFSLAPVHAHINLLGWATMGVMGLLHYVFAKQLVNRIAVVQFWLQQIATPVMMVALTLLLKGHTDMEPLVGISSIAVGIAVLLFVYNVMRNLKAAA